MRRALPWILAGLAALAGVGTVVSFAALMGDEDEAAPGYAIGYGRGGMMGGLGPGAMMGAWTKAEPIGTLDEAKERVEESLAASGFSGFRVAEAMRFENGIYVAVEEAPGQGAFELLLDERTGVVFPEPGPNMMWNTRYGMMAAFGGSVGSGMMGPGMMGGAAEPSEPGGGLGPEEARRIAGEWLAQARSGEEAGEPRAFPGYLTLDTEREGRPVGMLSVNAATGAVWFHSWHDRFLEEREY